MKSLNKTLMLITCGLLINTPALAKDKFPDDPITEPLKPVRYAKGEAKIERVRWVRNGDGFDIITEIVCDIVFEVPVYDVRNIKGPHMIQSSRTKCDTEADGKKAAVYINSMIDYSNHNGSDRKGFFVWSNSEKHSSDRNFESKELGNFNISTPSLSLNEVSTNLFDSSFITCSVTQPIPHRISNQFVTEEPPAQPVEPIIPCDGKKPADSFGVYLTIKDNQ